jgi:MFS family permease
LFTLSNSSDAFLLLKATDAGVSVALIPILWMTLHFSKVVFSLIGGELSDKVGRKPLIISGWLVYAVVYFGFGQADAEWQLWSLFIAYGLFFGLTEGAEKALVADLVGEEKRGTAFGLYNLAYSIGLFPASLLFGLIWYEFGDATAFTTGAALALIAAVAMSSVRIQRDDSTG